MIKQVLGVSLWSTFWVLLSFGLHSHSSAFSMLNYRAEGAEVPNFYLAEPYLGDIIDYHQSHPSFARRPLTTSLVKGLAEYSPLSLAEAFVWLNLGLFLLCGPLLYYLARTQKQSHRGAMLGVTIFYSSFSVLFAFFPSNYTYDEPLQYCLLLLAFLAWHRKAFALFVLAFTGSLIARETGLLLLPGMALFVLPLLRDTKGNQWLEMRQWAYLLLPTVFYAGYLWWWHQHSGWVSPMEEAPASRWTLVKYNFQNFQFTTESLCSMLMGWGLPTFIAWWYWRRNRLMKKGEKAWLAAFAMTLLLNSLLVLVATKARETRLFALPLILLWPLVGDQLAWLLGHWRRSVQYLRNNWRNFALALVGLAILLYPIAFHLYWPTGLDVNQNWHQVYFFSLLSAIASISCYQFWVRS